MRTRSRRYNEAFKLVDIKKAYTLKDAISLLKKLPVTKFDASLSVDFHLNIDPKKPEQMLRGTVILPHGTGKKIRIAVFAKGEEEKIAKDAGADIVGAEELIAKVGTGQIDFDCAVATPEMMKELSKLGKVLGPRGLMPSPKTGTVTNDVAKAISELKKGKVEYKTDKQCGIHIAIGKMSFSEEQLFENANKVISTVVAAKPATIKGIFVKSAGISSTMNPGLKLAI